MSSRYFITLLIFLVGCDTTEQAETPKQSAQLTDTEIRCVSDYKDFLYSIYAAELNTRNETLKGKNITKTIEATESLLKIHKSANLSDCPSALVKMVVQSQESLQDMLDIMQMQHDNPSTAMEHLSALHDSGQAFQKSTKQTVDYIKHIDIDEFVN